MAATLSIRDYLEHFLLNRDQQSSEETREKNQSSSRTTSSSSPVEKRFPDIRPNTSHGSINKFQHNHGIMLTHVHQLTNEGRDNLIYSNRIEGNKNKDVFRIFVQDMIGTKGMKASNRTMSRGSMSDISSITSSSDNEEGILQPKTTVSMKLTSSRSPSNIGSAELIGLLDYCRQHSIRVTIHLHFAHPYTWDNKYNREGLEKLHARCVKLAPVSFSQITQRIIHDLKENVESLDELQTCRGTIILDHSNVNRAISEFRQAVIIRSDFYYQDQQEQLAEILGQQAFIPQYKKFSTSDLPLTFSLEIYREYILLQNMDVEWVKLKVGTTKVKRGITKEEPAYNKIFGGSVKSASGNKNSPNSNKLDMDLIWDKVGRNVSMVDLSECEQIVLTVNVLLSEYNGRTGWVEEVTQLHNFLRDKTEESELYKVRVETRIRYAQSLDGPTVLTRSGNQHVEQNGLTNGYPATSFGFPKGMRIECLHIQDILFEMLEDLEDNIRHLGSLEYERGANICVDKEGLARAMGLLNRSIKIKTRDGIHSMNDDFVDEYAEDMASI